MGCETPIEFPTEVRNPELGVVSEFTKDKSLEVRVFEGQFLFEDSQTKYIEDAVVSIFRGDEFVEYLTLDQSLEPPSYITEKLIPVPEVEYRIKVEARGFKPVMAKSQVPNSTPISSAVISDLLVNSEEGSTGRNVQYQVAVAFKDPLKVANFYHLNLIQEVRILRDEKDDTGPPPPEMRKVTFSSMQDNNQFIAFSNGGLLFRDESFEGQFFDNRFALNFDLKVGEELGLLFIELRSVSEEYYLYQTSLSRQGSNPGFPIDDGVSIYNNIENGRGIFAGYNISNTAVEVIH